MGPAQNAIKLVTFDAYNTLFKPRGSTTAQYMAEASNVGIHVTREGLSRAFGPIFKKQMGRHPFYGFREGMSPRRWWEELVYDTFITAGVSRHDLDPNFAKLFNSLYIRFSSDVGYAAFPDAIDTLQQLKRQRIKTGVISNSDERLHDVLKNLKMTEHLDFVLPSYRCGYEKPAHEIFDVALRNVRPPISAKEALHVGDDLHADYRGALNAGWNALLLERGKLSYEDVPTAQPQSTDSILTLHDLYPRILSGFNNVQKETR